MAPKVAIACQGGGSHAAFAAGVLLELLSQDNRSRFELAGISGTSGGAICAALAWFGLVHGGPAEAIARLSGFWETLKADTLPDIWANFLGVTLADQPWTMELSPYFVPAPAELIMRSWLEDELDLRQLPNPLPPQPALLIGATDVLSGERAVFTGSQLSYDVLIASAAVPFLYEAVKVNGSYFWDGLFSVNPPVRELIDLDIDELWIVQINPQRVDEVPRSTREIVDRRNELSGNLSLAQELHFVETINDLIARHGPLTNKEGRPYRYVTVRIVPSDLWDPADPDKFDYASKLNRAPWFIDELIARGRAAAPKFFSPDSLGQVRNLLPTEERVMR